MKDDTAIAAPRQPGAILEPLTVIAREGGRQTRRAALRSGVTSFVGNRLNRTLKEQWADSTGRRNTLMLEVLMTTGRRKSARRYRRKLVTPDQAAF